jgi:hypothetical protein
MRAPFKQGFGQPDHAQRSADTPPRRRSSRARRPGLRSSVRQSCPMGTLKATFVRRSYSAPPSTRQFWPHRWQVRSSDQRLGSRSTSTMPATKASREGSASSASESVPQRHEVLSAWSFAPMHQVISDRPKPLSVSCRRVPRAFGPVQGKVATLGAAPLDSSYVPRRVADIAARPSTSGTASKLSVGVVGSHPGPFQPSTAC